MKKLFLLLALVATLSLNALGQNITVRGTVVGASDQEPIVGATIQAKGTNLATSTDIEGHFTIQVPTSCKKLLVTYVGMYPVEVDVKPNVSVEMELNAQSLDEVVVTGYGQTKKAAFTGAASVVDGDIVDRKSEVNFVKSLEGQVTGFQYNNSTSAPGQYGSVTIRGRGTLGSSSQPLYVIDGIPVNAEYDYLYSTDNSFFDPLAAYNPADIESVTVLKDAAATAIYGSRAANGVIVITTKKGAEGRLSVTFETRQGFSMVGNNNMKFATAQQMLPWAAYGDYAAGYYATYEDALAGYTQEMMGYGWDGKSSTNWMDEVTRKGYFGEYNLSVAGSTGKTNYYINMNYSDAEGIVIGSSNKRYGGRVNVDTKYKWLSAGMNASYSYNENVGFSQSTSGSMENPIVGAVSNMTPFYPVRINGEYANITEYNPVAVLDPELGDINENLNSTLVANPWLKIDLPYGLWIKTNFGANISDFNIYQYITSVYSNVGIAYGGVGTQQTSKRTILTWNNTIGWSYSFGKNNFDVLLGQEMQKNTYWQEYIQKNNFPFGSEGMRDLSTASEIMDAGYYKEESTLASYFLDAHYDYDNKYYLSASYRVDGSSVFGANKRWGNFWSLGAKWRLSQENWLKDNDVISNADIRISYGTVGNQGIGVYVARGVYALGANYMNMPGMIPTTLSNPNLTWETSKKFDLGFDLSFIQRWHLTFDFYNENTVDALYDYPLSMTTGLASTKRNVGKIRNRGVEIGINGTAFHSNDVVVNVFANMTYNQNKVMKLVDGLPIEYTYQIIEEGRPYYQWYTKEYAGVNPKNGRALYYLNETGDETTENYNDAAKRYLGSPLPKVYGAFGVSGNAYGFDWALQFNYRLGGKVLNTGAAFTGWGYSGMTPLEKVALNSWTPDNPNAEYPEYRYGSNFNAVSGNYSSRFLMSSDYLRLSNITLGYTLPAKLTRKAFMQKVRIYTTFDNVYTWTASDFTGYNPDTYANGVIAWQYPSAFTFTGGVQITF